LRFFTALGSPCFRLPLFRHGVFFSFQQANFAEGQAYSGLVDLDVIRPLRSARPFGLRYPGSHEPPSVPTSLKQFFCFLPGRPPRPSPMFATVPILFSFPFCHLGPCPDARMSVSPWYPSQYPSVWVITLLTQDCCPGAGKHHILGRSFCYSSLPRAALLFASPIPLPFLLTVTDTPTALSI